MEDKCPNCGAFLENGVCPYCGYEAVPDDQQSNDGVTEIHVADTAVISAASSQNAYDNIQPGTINVRVVSPKSKVTALLLCIFLGVFGAHRFYAGKIISGVVYFFTGGIFLLGVAFDLIMIIIGAFTDSNGLPIKD